MYDSCSLRVNVVLQIAGGGVRSLFDLLVLNWATYAKISVEIDVFSRSACLIYKIAIFLLQNSSFVGKQSTVGTIKK